VWAAVVTGALWPGEARAWTEAEVRTVAAHVSIRPDGGAHVALELTVRVRRGWLEGLEVTGLDPHLVPDPARPPRWRPVIDPDGDAPPEADAEPADLEPDLHVRGGGVQFRFPRRRAPRRGTYRATFDYFTTVQHRRVGADQVRLTWTLPAWRAGLDDVRVTLDAPPGARSADADQDTPSNISVTHAEQGGQSRITFHRAHLPRTLAWPLAIDVPIDAVDASLLPEPDGGPAPSSPAPPGDDGSQTPTWPWPAALLLGLLAIGKIHGHRREGASRGLRSRGLVPLPWWARAMACAAAAVGGTLLYGMSPSLGLPLLATIPVLTWARVPVALPPARLGAYRPLHPTDRRWAAGRRRRAWAAPLALMDLGSPAGLGLLAAAAVGAGAATVAWTSPAPWAWLHGLAVLIPLGLAASPRTLPLRPEARLHLLERLARHLRGDPSGHAPYALRPWIHEDAAGAWQDVRLRVEVPRPAAGLVHLDLAVGYQPERGELRPEPVLLAVAHQRSAADAQLEAAPVRPSARLDTPGRRVVRVLPLGADPDGVVSAAARAVSGPLAAPADVSGLLVTRPRAVAATS
jgi:hypothetical protein